MKYIIAIFACILLALDALPYSTEAANSIGQYSSTWSNGKHGTWSSAIGKYQSQLGGGASSPTPTGTPSPAPTYTNCAPPFSAPNGYPDSCWQPYVAGSIWRLASAQQASPAPSSSPWLNYYINTAHFPMFTDLEFGYSNESNQYQHPIYFGHSSDPLYTFSCAASWSSTTPPCTGTTYHVPTYAIPAGGTDRHMSIVDETTYTEVDCWQASPAPSPMPSGTNTIHAQACNAGSLTTSDGTYWGETHAGTALWSGVIRAQELIQGVINHPLNAIAPCTSNATQVFPSTQSYSTDTQCAGNAGAPYGGWIRLNMTTSQILTSGAPTDIMVIMFALQNYGAFIVDTNGNNQFSLQTEADQMYTAPGYSDPNCPSNGAPCTPLTAWEHSMGDPDWNGSRYVLNVGKWVPPGSWQFIINPPGS